MRRISVFLVIAAAALCCAIGLGVTSSAAPGPLKAGAPNFVCVSTPYFGVCVGPPTQQG